MAGGDNSKKRSLELALTTKSKVRRKVHLKISDQLGSIVHIECKRDIPLRKVLLKYCESKNLEYGAVNFLYNGSRVLVRSTADELHMEDGDEIEAMVHVNGGGDPRAVKNMF